MKPKHLLWIGAAFICCWATASRSDAAQPKDPLIRLAELEIDPGQLPEYKAALKAEITASIRLEPGVLKLYAVSVKDKPNQVRLFEMYRDQASYQSHLQSPHFKHYKTITQHMVKSLTLIEAEPVLLGSR